MFTKEDIEKIVRSKIESDESLGTQKGGSDHIGHTSYEIVKISDPEKVDYGLEITYEYSTITVTEFTIWPDNPPWIFNHSKSIVINDKGEIIKESEKKTNHVEGGTEFLPLDDI